MAITRKTPSRKITVGSQYICMNTMDANNDWTGSFSSDVTKLPTVVNVEVTDNADSYESYASGAIYDADTPIMSQDIAEENIAFPATLLATMRGEEVDAGCVPESAWDVRRKRRQHAGVLSEECDGDVLCVRERSRGCGVLICHEQTSLS